MTFWRVSFRIRSILKVIFNSPANVHFFEAIILRQCPIFSLVGGRGEWESISVRLTTQKEAPISYLLIATLNVPND